MVAFSKYALLGDLIITPILQAVEALPTDLMRHIGQWVTAPCVTELAERYNKLRVAVKKIRLRTDAEWIQYATANFARFGYEEKRRYYCRQDWKFKKTEDGLLCFGLTLKNETETQYRRYSRYITQGLFFAPRFVADC